MQWDISSAVYSTFKSISEDASPTGVAFNGDGSKMFVAGATNAKIYEYDLSLAWDSSTAVYSTFFAISEDALPRGVKFNDDGTKMFVPGSTNAKIYEYVLSTGWSLATAAYSTEYDVSGKDATPTGVDFNDDGTKMYVMGAATGKVYEYDLSSAWTVSTATYLQDFYVGHPALFPFDAQFNNDGTKMYVVIGLYGYIYEYELITAWDITSAVFGWGFDGADEDDSPTGIVFKPNDGTKMYVAGMQHAKVYEYDLSAWSGSTAISDYNVVNWSVSKSISDALWTLTAQIDKHVTPTLFAKIKAVAKDHNGTDRTPFVGIFPSADYIMAPAANKATLTGHDFAWYLSTQYVPASVRTDDVNMPNPADVVNDLLGASEYDTGIARCRIIQVDSTWWTANKKEFKFDDKCTKWKAIQTMCDYCEYIFVIKPYLYLGVWYSGAYFIPETDIDSATVGLDLPAMVTFTAPDAHLMKGTQVKDTPEKKYNRVSVTGYDNASDTYFRKTDETAAVAATPPTERAIEYFYANTDLNTQAKVDARATELLAYFQASSKVYIAKFKQRMDLELYQKIKFSGYDKIATDDMRITRITYSHAVAKDVVEVEFSKDQDVQQLKRLTKAADPDYVTGAQDVVNDDLRDIGLTDQFNAAHIIKNLDMGDYDILSLRALQAHAAAGIIIRDKDGFQIFQFDASGTNECNLPLNMEDEEIKNVEYIEFALLGSAPSSVEGRLYYDAAANTLKYRDNTDWRTLTST